MGASSDLRQRINHYLSQWRSMAPTRTVLEAAARNVVEWKNRTGAACIWEKAPLMVTATLDDGWGNGIQLIHLFAEAAGVRVFSLGLLQNVASVLTVCREKEPDLLGVTVLQLDTEEPLSAICRGLPSKTRVVAGGPVFSADPDLAARAGVFFVARNAADFWRFLLECEFPS